MEFTNCHTALGVDGSWNLPMMAFHSDLLKEILCSAQLRSFVDSELVT